MDTPIPAQLVDDSNKDGKATIVDELYGNSNTTPTQYDLGAPAASTSAPAPAPTPSTTPYAASVYNNTNNVNVDSYNDETMPASTGAKVGARFLGCCDMRRAVIILNVLSLIGYALTLYVYEYQKDVLDRLYAVTYVDDDLQSALDDLIDTASILIWVGVGMSFIGIAGAYYYIPVAVVLRGLYIVVAWIVEYVLTRQFAEEFNLRIGIIGTLINAIITIIFGLYPHFTLAYEMFKKTMTKETYPREEMSCCCV